MWAVRIRASKHVSAFFVEWVDSNGQLGRSVCCLTWRNARYALWRERRRANKLNLLNNLGQK